MVASLSLSLSLSHTYLFSSPFCLWFAGSVLHLPARESEEAPVLRQAKLGWRRMLLGERGPTYPAKPLPFLKTGCSAFLRSLSGETPLNSSSMGPCLNIRGSGFKTNDTDQQIISTFSLLLVFLTTNPGGSLFFACLLRLSVLPIPITICTIY